MVNRTKNALSLRTFVFVALWVIGLAGVAVAADDDAFAGYANVALGKPVTASSIFKDYVPERAVDGVWDNNTSRWLSDRDAQPPHWLEIDLQGEHRLVGARVLTGHVLSDRPPAYLVSEFKLQYWTGTAWQDIPGTAVQGNTEEAVTFVFAEPVVTAKVRFYSEEYPPLVDGVRVLRVREILLFGELASK